MSTGMNRTVRRTLAGIAVFAAIGVGAEIYDFWDTSGRKAEEPDSEVSSGVASLYFVTEHEKSSEVSAGNKINTYPPAGVLLLVR